MKNLRGPAVSLLVYNALFFSMDKAGAGNISAFVYLLGIFIAATAIFLPIIKKIPTLIQIVFYLGIYVFIKWLINDNNMLSGILQRPDIFIETSMLAIMVVLAARFSRAILDAEESFEKFALANVGDRDKPIKEAMGDVEKEIFRSRRYNRPLSLLVIEPDPSSSKAAAEHLASDIRRSMVERYLYTSLGKILRKLMRRSDLIMEHPDKGQFIVLCPETPNSRFQDLARRIQSSAAEKLKISVALGSASFPEESLTFDELVQKAQSQIEHSPKLLKSSGKKHGNANAF